MGANGAGKSTLFDILATLDKKFSGSLKIAGMDSNSHRAKIRKEIGYVPGSFSLYEDLTVKENLLFFSKIYNCSLSNVLEEHNSLWGILNDHSGVKARNLSGGMRQKLSILCALAHSPSVLLLDEPTTGIDPASRLQLWKELTALRNRGLTIIASTHYNEEVQFMDRILLLHEGIQLMYDTPENLNTFFEKDLIRINGDDPVLTLKVLKQELVQSHCYIKNRGVNVITGKYDADAIFDICRKHGLQTSESERINPDMEDLFIYVLLKKDGGRR